MKNFGFVAKILAVFGFLMVVAVSGWGANPEINVQGNSNSISDNDNTPRTADYTDFGSANLGTAINRTFTIQNTGGAALTVETVTISGTNASDFTVTTQPSASIAANSSTTFTVRFIPSDIGVRLATISFVNNDTNENPYNFSIQGTGTTPSYAASNHRPFTMAYTANEKGNIKIIGNSVLTTATGCTTLPNNAVSAVNADQDSDGATFNSTSANLTLPAGVTGSDIEYAGLYWQARLQSGTLSSQQAQARTVKLKLPGGSYQTITSNPAKFNWSKVSGHDDYQGVANITTLIQGSVTQNATASGYSQSIWVADVLARTGTTNLYGAWSIVLVYKDGTTTLKNLSAYDGYLGINTSTAAADRTVALSGFLTPNTYPVNASFLIFGGEGDKYYGDSVTLSNLSGDHALKSTGDVFDSTITDATGSNVGTRNPACSNTLGADIHSYNIGKINSSDTSGIIETGQSTTTVKLSSFTVNPWPPAGSTGITDSQANSYDTFFPGVFAFATDLYEPDVCYIENIFQGTTNISGVGAQVNKDENLTVRVYIKNKGAEAASGVSILHQFDSSFPYVANSANYNNSNPAYETLMPPSYARTTATDSAGNDLYEYSSTSLLSKINLGTLATSGSGGTFDSNTTTAVFEYNATVQILDSNYSNVYKAGYTNSVLGVDYTNTPVTISSCDGSKNSFWGYYLPPSVSSDFDVAHTTYYNNGLGTDIPTQIASKVNDFKILSYESGTSTPKLVNTTVAVELVDASSGTCATHTPISDFKTWIPFHNANQAELTASSIIAGVILYDSDAARKFYQKAGKNVKFRISHPTDGSGGVIIMRETESGKYHLDSFPSYAGNSCVESFTATTFNPANGNMQGEHTYTQVPEACANAGQSGASAMTQHEVNVCLECIYGTNVAYMCSTDNFANRPDTYTTSTISPSPLVAGQDFSLTTTAKGYGVGVSLTGYDGNANIDANITDPAKTCAVPDGNLTIGGVAPAVIHFNGVDTNVSNNVKFGDVGVFDVNITDSTWTAVDSIKSPIECIDGSDTNIADANGKIGCLTRSTINNQIVIPDHFDVNGTLTNGSNGFTYLNNFDTNASLDQNISATLNAVVTAKAFDINTTTQNYSSECYAKAGTSTLLTLALVPAPPTGDLTQLLWYDDNNNSVVGNFAIAGPFSFTHPAARFTSGVGNLNYRLNFDRNVTKVVNPFQMTIPQMGVVDADGVDGNNSIDNNATFLFGRTHASRQRYYDATAPYQGPANIYFESFCFGAPCNKTLLPNGINSTRTDDVRWYVNGAHAVPHDGTAGTVSEKSATPHVTATAPTATNPSQTTLTYDGNNGFPYKTTMQNTASVWLIQNETNPNTTTNEFQVEFDLSGGWTGEHETNTTTKSVGGTTTNRRIMW